MQLDDDAIISLAKAALLRRDDRETKVLADYINYRTSYSRALARRKYGREAAADLQMVLLAAGFKALTVVVNALLTHEPKERPHNYLIRSLTNACINWSEDKKLETFNEAPSPASTIERSHSPQTWAKWDFDSGEPWIAHVVILESLKEFQRRQQTRTMKQLVSVLTMRYLLSASFAEACEALLFDARETEKLRRAYDRALMDGRLEPLRKIATEKEEEGQR